MQLIIYLLAISILQKELFVSCVFVVFRPRSRHTASFLPESSIDLQLFEMACILNCTDITATPIDSYPVEFQRLSIPTATVTAASKSVLLFGLYGEVDAKALSTSTTDTNAKISITDTPNPTKQQLAAFQAIHGIKSSTSRGGIAVGIFAPSLNCSAHTRLLLVGICLARGIATSPLSSAVSDPLPRRSAFRRPDAGVLNRFALRRLPLRFKTSIEPELALLMVNLAGIADSGPGETNASVEMNRIEEKVVLDPFCGAAVLLLAAQMQNHRVRGIGTDAMEMPEAIIAGINSNFAMFNLAPPLIQPQTPIASLASTEHSAGFCGSVNAIVTDPPYDMGAKIAANSQLTFEDGILVDLLRLANDTLVPGGRLVFFCPWKAPSAELVRRVAPLLHMVRVFPQAFSATFTRYLCVMEKLRQI